MAMRKKPRRVKIRQEQDDWAATPSRDEIPMAPNTKKRRRNLKAAPDKRGNAPAVKPKKPKKAKSFEVVEGGVLSRLNRHCRSMIWVSAVAVIAVLILIGNLLIPAGLGEWMQNGFCTWGGGDGLPVTLEDDTVRGLYTRGSLSFVLTDSSLFAYSGNGKEVTALQHGYLTPVADVSQTRTLLYDRGNYSLRVDTLGRNLVNEEFEDAIVTADLCDSGAVAVAFDDAEYASTVLVYNKRFSPCFKQSYSEETVTAVQLSPNGKTLAIVTVRSEGGAFASTLYLYQVKTGAKLCQEKISGSMIAAVRSNRDRLFIASNDTLVSCRWDGSDRRSYDVSNISYLSGQEGAALAVVFNPNGERNDTVLLLDRKGNEAGRFDLGGTGNRLCVNRSKVFALSGDEVTVYDFEGNRLDSFAVGYEASYLAPSGGGLVLTSDMKLQFHE